MNNRETIKTYLTGREILSPKDLPVDDSQRTCTDLFCTIFSSIFAIALFITAIIQLNPQNLINMTYPTDSIGRKCTLDNSNYNYLYFVQISDHTRRMCVEQCPKGNQNQLRCWPTDQISCSANDNPQFQVNIYPSTAQQTRLGLFCWPDDQKLKDQIMQQSDLKTRFNFIEYQTSLFISLGIAFGLGVIYLIVLLFIPKPIVYISIGLGGISCLLAGIFMMANIGKFDAVYAPWIGLTGVFLILFGIFLIVSIALSKKRQQIELCAFYVQKSIKLLVKQPGLWLLMLIFLILTIGLVALCVFQVFASWSSSKLQFDKQSIYYFPTGTFLEIQKILIIIEGLWGFFFLKEAFSFIVSGCGVTHHFLNNSLLMFGIRNLFKYHWGSVVGGSFMANFFFFPDVVYDIIKPTDTRSKFYSVCCCCERVLGFVRSQSFGFINMTGLPYCNASRWCQKISTLSQNFDGRQSINRYFRMGSHSFLAVIATIAAFFHQFTSGNIHPVGIIISFILNFFFVTYFVCLPADLAETYFISQITEDYINGDKMNQTPYIGSNRKNQYRQSDVNDGYQVLPTHHS